MKKVFSFEITDYNVEKIDESLRKVFSSLELTKRFSDGKKIILKPNLLTKPNSTLNIITTNPIVVESVIKILLSSGIQKEKIFIADGSSAIHKDMEQIFKQTGFWEVSEKYGIELVNLNRTKYFIKDKIKVSDFIKDNPHIINIAKLKTHMLTKLTLSVKNLYGLIPGESKLYYHTRYPDQESFSDFLSKLYNSVRPELNIVDGIVGMQGNGPGGGDYAKTELLLASEDGFALDDFIASLLGFKTSDIPFLKMAIRNGFYDGRYEVLGSFHKLEMRMPDRNKFSLSLNFAKQKFVKHFTSNFPKVITEKCTRCYRCYKSCPAGAINLVDGYPHIRERLCITCYCCVEVCQFKSIRVKKSTLEKWYEKFKK
ncbi:MAG: DUF362 domain-containing protein [bacterium]|nr:DUF362 domain-containing protein [bacterium]